MTTGGSGHIEDLLGTLCQETWLGGPALSYPRRPRSVVDLLDRAVGRFGPRVFLTSPTDEDITFVAFAELVEGAAERLAEEGLGGGDRLAVVGNNSLDLAVALFACARAGLVMVGMSTRLAPRQWAYLLGHSRASLALGDPEYLEGLIEAAGRAGMAPGRARAFGDHLIGRRRPWSYGPEQRPAEDATYAVVYTSGTTGRPKASRVVHRASVHSALSYAQMLDLGPNDVTAVVFSLTYISAMHAHLLPMLAVGGRCVLVADPKPTELVETIRRQQVSWLYVVPALWQRLLRVRALASPALDHLRLGGFGGSPMPLPAIAELRRRLPGMALRDIYGLSETHSPAAVLLDEEFADHPGSVGRPLACMEARVVDAAGSTVPAGVAGELHLRGSLVTTGYEGDPEASAAAIGPDGWFRTGDVARADDDGYLYILDRVKDMIDRGGHKIFSAELERVLRDHPQVDDAAVVGVPDGLAGQAVAAFVVVAGEVPSVELRHWVRDRLADYAAPRWVHVVDDFPRNPTGKVLKGELRQRAEKLAGRSPKE